MFALYQLVLLTFTCFTRAGPQLLDAVGRFASLTVGNDPVKLTDTYSAQIANLGDYKFNVEVSSIPDNRPQQTSAEKADSLTTTTVGLTSTVSKFLTSNVTFQPQSETGISYSSTLTTHPPRATGSQGSPIPISRASSGITASLVQSRIPSGGPGSLHWSLPSGSLTIAPTIKPSLMKSTHMASDSRKRNGTGTSALQPTGTSSSSTVHSVSQASTPSSGLNSSVTPFTGTASPTRQNPLALVVLLGFILLGTF